MHIFINGPRYGQVATLLTLFLNMYSCVGLFCFNFLFLCGKRVQTLNIPYEITTEMQINFLLKYLGLISRLTTKMEILLG